VETVVNFDLPPTLRAYTHRVGRTARGGNSGTALSLVAPSEASGLDTLVEKQVGMNPKPKKSSDALNKAFSGTVFDEASIGVYRVRVVCFSSCVRDELGCTRAWMQSKYWVAVWGTNIHVFLAHWLLCSGEEGAGDSSAIAFQHEADRGVQVPRGGFPEAGIETGHPQGKASGGPNRIAQRRNTQEPF
jgi:hypothetical protein